jgi:hypothetical protein
VKVMLHVNRLLNKSENQIYEIFTITPKKFPILNDDSRAISFEIWKTRSELAIHKNFPLVDIQYYGDKIIYIYKNIETNTTVNLLETKEITYMPMLGKRKCSNCERSEGNICTYKGTQVNKKIIKCLYWKEKRETVLEKVCTSQKTTKRRLPNF